ncbi:UNVERIFIED_CONTAM: hypothetical protein GTU68_010896 [Idotea baltica]|nr:hypothetical protein [Idotea baltica]
MLNSPGKVNVINLEVTSDVDDILKEIKENPKIIGGVIASDKPGCFIAGADINLLSTIKSAEEATKLSRGVQQFLNIFETSKKPFVAAIMGSCLGGGLEVALACHYRIAVDKKSVFGFPEVMLGLLPGAGGTLRLPKLVGLPNSLDMMLTGKNIRPDKAESMGLVDLVIPSLGPGFANGDLKIKRSPKGLFNVAQRNLLKTKYMKDYVFKQARKKVMKQSKGLYPAPLEILEVVREGLDKPKEISSLAEAKGFGDLAASEQSKGLISLYQGQTECKKFKYEKSRNPVKNIAVIGAGLMGAGVADISIRNEFKTVLKDTNQENLGRGIEQIEKNIKLSQKKKKISSMHAEHYMSNLITTTDYDKFATTDMVIEAVFEDVDLKKKVLKDMEKVLPDHCIYATNTSALLVSDIAKASSRPEKVIGMHYFSPVDKMALLEIVKADSTSEDTVKKAVEVGLKQGKTPIVVKDGPGFYTTRIFMPMIIEVFRLMTEGVDPERIDNLCMALGFPVGGVVLSDEVGIDVGYHVYCYFVEVFGDRMKSIDLSLGKAITEAGFLGNYSLLSM